MSFPSPAPTVPRRAVLRSVAIGAVAVAAAGSLSSCTSDPAPPSPDPSTASADDALRREAAAAELGLAARYAATTAAFPAAADLLAVGDRHAEYAAALAGPDGPGAPPTTPGVPGRRTTAVAALRDAERAAATKRREQCGRASDTELARTLALVGAGCAAAGQVLAAAGG